MSRPNGLSGWTDLVSIHLPHLSPAQARVLALWSYGIVFTHCCGLTTVAAFVAGLVDRREDALRQQLREWCYEAKAKRGRKRQALDVTTCFAPLLHWILTWWPATDRRLVLALDASTLGQRFTVLAIAVVYRGTAIPVAWTIVRATQPGAWRPHWERMLDQLQGSVPADWLVLVTADRGLYARWLFQRIVTLGWHPFLRIQQGGSFRPVGQTRFRPLTRAVPTIGRCYGAVVDCFSTDAARLRCTLVACWDAGHTDPWLIVTDLPVREAEARWYGLRIWIEAMFKDLKRDGWQWQATRMEDPGRAERLWLALAVASIWVVSVGGAADATRTASGLAEDAPRRPAARQVSCFQRGLLALLQAALRGQPLPLGRFIPEPWAPRRGTSLTAYYYHRRRQQSHTYP